MKKIVLTMLAVCLFLNTPISAWAVGEAPDGKPSISTEIKAENGEAAPFIGSPDNTFQQLAPSEEVSPEFEKKYPNGEFIFKLVDDDASPIVNAFVRANLGYQWYRDGCTNGDGEVKFFLPEYSAGEFIAGEYEFKIRQPHSDEPNEEIFLLNLTEQNTYPCYTLKITRSVAIERGEDEKLLNVAVLRADVPAKNIWVELALNDRLAHPTGVCVPNSGWTDKLGEICFTDLPAGEYRVSAWQAPETLPLGGQAVVITDDKLQSCTISIK